MRELDDAEVGAEVAAGAGAGLDQAGRGSRWRAASSWSSVRSRRSRGDVIDSRMAHGGESTSGVTSWSRTATAGSCRLPSQTRPSCSRTPVTMWYGARCSGADVDVVDQLPVVVVRLDPDGPLRLGLQPLRDPGRRRRSEHRARLEPLDERVASGWRW